VTMLTQEIGYGTIKTVPVFCGYGTVKSWRFGNSHATQPPTLDGSVSAK